MKIVHVIPYMHPAAGGPPVVVDRLAREFVRLNHDVQVLTTDLFSAPNDGWPDAKQRPYRMAVFAASADRKYAYSPELSQAIGEAVRKCDVMHVHTLWTHASLAAMKACRRADVPWLVMPHGMLDPHSLRRGWLKKQVYGRLVEWPLVRQAAGMCYTHPEEERLARASCSGLPPGILVELGADSPPNVPASALRDEFLNRNPQLRERQIILFLGRLHPKKGLDLLIPAFARVLRKQPEAHLLLVGPGEADYVAVLRGKIAARGLWSSVTLMGPLFGQDKWGAMAASQLFVLPSYQENFALTVVDALRSGLPVMLSRRVNLWQDVVCAGAGRACELTVESIAEEILDCLTNSRWQSDARAAGARLLESRFNWATTASRLEAAYASLSKSPPLLFAEAATPKTMMPS